LGDLRQPRQQWQSSGTILAAFFPQSGTVLDVNAFTLLIGQQEGDQPQFRPVKRLPKVTPKKLTS